MELLRAQVFHAGTLEMTLNSGGDFDPQLTLDQTVIKNISVNKSW